MEPAIKPRRSKHDADYPRQKRSGSLCYPRSAARSIDLDEYLILDKVGKAHRAFRLACKNGNLDVVKYLHSNYPGSIGIGTYDNYALRLACQNGHTDVVQYLIDNFGSIIDVAAMRFSAVKKACTNNRPGVLRLLIDNYRDMISMGNASLFSDITLTTVCTRDYEEIAIILLTTFPGQFQLKPGMFERALKAMCEKGWAGVINLALGEAADHDWRYQLINKALIWVSGAEPTWEVSYDDFWICIGVLASTYKELIDTETINQLFLDYCIRWTGSNGYFETALTEFKDRITVKTRNTALEYTCMFQKTDAFKRVLSEFRSDFTDPTCNQAFLNACESDSESMATTLIEEFSTRLTPETCNTAFTLLCGHGLVWLANELVKHHGSIITDVTYTNAFRSAWVNENEWVTISLTKEYESLIDINAMDADLFSQHFPRSPNLIRLVLKAYKDRISSEAIRKTMFRQHQNQGIIGLLIAYLRDRIDGSQTILDALALGERCNEHTMGLLTNSFKDTINYEAARVLLQLPSSLLYRYMGVQRVTGMVMAHRHQKGFDLIARSMDQSHPNTSIVLASLRPRRSRGGRL